VILRGSPGWRVRRCAVRHDDAEADRQGGAEGDEEKVRQSLLKGENPIRAIQRPPLLMIAVMDGQVAVVETLLKGGSCDALDPRGLHLAAPRRRAGRRRIADLLLKRKCQAQRPEPPGGHGR
jgi:hypothetical protein